MKFFETKIRKYKTSVLPFHQANFHTFVIIDILLISLFPLLRFPLIASFQD